MSDSDQTWIQRQNQAAERKRQLTGGMAAPYLAVVTGIDAANERLRVMSHGGQLAARMLHPFDGRNAWIRTIPETGAATLMQYRSDSTEPEVMRYYEREPQRRLEAFRNGTSAARPLLPGEIDVASSGYAQHYFGEEPVQDRSAGAVFESLNQGALSIESRAPTHWRALHQNEYGKMGDEERLGVVWRWKPGSLYRQTFVTSDRDNLGPYTIAQRLLGYETGPWAREYLRLLGSGVETPEFLTEVREGDVIDDSGRVVRSLQTGNPLRSLRRFYTEDAQFLSVEIDNLGNMSTSLPTTAETGYDLRIPNGTLAVTALRARWLVREDFNLSAQRGVQVLSESVRVGPAANEQAVLGTTLQGLLSSLLGAITAAQFVNPATGPSTLDPATAVQLSSLKSQVDAGTILSDFIFLSKSA